MFWCFSCAIFEWDLVVVEVWGYFCGLEVMASVWDVIVVHRRLSILLGRIDGFGAFVCMECLFGALLLVG